MTASREASERRARQPLGERRYARAARIIDLARADLPTEHRLLLENIGAARWRVVDRALADSVDDLEMMLARIAWHEWGHALSVVRAEADDVADGERLLTLAPRGVSERIRRAGYRRSQFTHELVADIYALLMSRRRRGETGKPPWLDDRIYRLVRRISTWTD